MKKQSNSSAVAAATGDVRTQLGVIGDDLRTLGRQVRTMTTQQLHSMGDRAKELGDDIGDRVRENPIRSLFLAAGIGAVVGLLLWRR